MTTTSTPRLLLLKPTPGTAHAININEANGNMDKLDNNFIPAAKIFMSVTQLAIPNNSTTVCDYDSTSFDSYATRPEGPMADLVNNWIIIRKAGVYICSINGNFVANATGVRRLDLAKNGIIQAGAGPYLSFVGGQNGLGFTTALSLAVNDKVSAQAFQNSGGTLDFGKNTFVEGDSLSVIWHGSLT